MNEARVEVTYRNAERRDLPTLGQLYLLAFADSVREMRTPGLSAAALADTMGACLAADKGSIIVAEAGGEGEPTVVGYVIAIANAHHVWRAALLQGLALVWVWRWLTGRYRLPLQQSLGLFRDKLRLWAVWRSSVYRCPARILSMAVHPRWQRRGIGAALLDRALSHLRERGCVCVGLEVRPGNRAAKVLYERDGFRKVGQFQSTRGGWEVMLLPLSVVREDAAGRRRLLRALLIVAAVAALVGAHAWLVTYLRWKAALRKAGFTDEMARPGEGDRILVVAPHPDDEVLGCGGLIDQAVAAGAEVHVAIMTNGDASELSIILGEKDLSLSSQAYVALGLRRQQESLRALAVMGVPPDRVHFLSYPNNGLTALWRPEHWLYSQAYTSPYTQVSASPYRDSVTPQAPYCGLQVLSDLVSLLDEVRPTAIYVTHSQDIHPDHWATSAFVQYALATVAARGSAWARETRAYGYLVHWPRFPVPLSLRPGLDLLPPADLHSGVEWLRLPLSTEQASQKLRCIMMYRTQLPRFDRLLKGFARANEIFSPLPVAETAWGIPQRWHDENSHRRNLAGAEITAVDLTIDRDGALRTLVETAARPLGRRSYVAVDVRTWDQGGAPVLMTLYAGGADLESPPRRADAPSAAGHLWARADLVRGGARRQVPLVVQRPAPGVLEFRGVSLGEAVARQSLFVTCWGSVRDRVIDPAVVSRVELPAAK